MALPRLIVEDAHRRRHGHELLGFRCWSGDSDEAWVQEVEEYVQLFVLKDCTKTLLFRERGGPIVGVSAFDRQEIALTDQRRVPGWRLQVIALERSWRGVLVGAELPGCDDAMKASEYVLRKTYERMLALDRRRAIVVAKVHDDNVASMRATARVGLFRTRRVDDFYWEMLGEVDPAIRPE